MVSQTREGSEGRRCKAVLAGLGRAAQPVAAGDRAIARANRRCFCICSGSGIEVTLQEPRGA